MTRSASRLAFAALLLAVGAMVLQAGTVPHLHVDADAGLFNEEHDLTLLAGLAGHAIQLGAVPVLAVDAVSTAVTPSAPERPATPLARSGDSRAPPVA